MPSKETTTQPAPPDLVAQGQDRLHRIEQDAARFKRKGMPEPPWLRDRRTQAQEFMQTLARAPTGKREG